MPLSFTSHGINANFLADNAYKRDPRIKKHKAAEKEAKRRIKEAKYEALRKAKEEQERLEAEERERKEKEAKAKAEEVFFSLKHLKNAV